METVLKQLGHDAELVERIKRGETLFVRVLKYPFRRFRRWLNQKLHVDNKGRGAEIQPFVKRYIRHRIVSDYAQVKPEEYDAYVVGSDQIWRESYVHNYLYDTFLSFTKGWKVKRIAYAASFGNATWDYSVAQTSACRRLIQMFDAVSVRERSAVDLCREHLGVTPLHLLDPTMLLTKEDYLQLIHAAHLTKRKGILFSYILNPTEEKLSMVNKIANGRGLTPFVIVYRKEDKDVFPSIEAWLNGFNEADFVVTDSFHACVYSTIFGVPYVVFGYDITGLSRMESLLEMLDMRNHLLLSNVEYDSTCEYKVSVKTTEILAKKREESWVYLRDSLISGCKG
jgi:hypothetical protein